MEIEQHPATRFVIKPVKESRFSHVRLGYGRKDGAVLEQDLDSESLLKCSDLIADQAQRLVIQDDR